VLIFKLEQKQAGVPSQKITSNEKIIQDCSIYSKITPTGFQGIKGVVYSKFMPIGTTINSKQYCERMTSGGSSSHQANVPSA
jgi:hypothetical protein